jgi:hypothetical protein
MSAVPVADNSFSPHRVWRDAVAAARLLETQIDARRGVPINAFTRAPAAISNGDRSAFRAGGAR